jgi:archaemetzincin
MSVLHLVRIGEMERRAVETLQAALARAFGLSCDVLPAGLDADFAFHPGRQQYHSTELLGRLDGLVRPDSWRVLGVTHVDLFIPILTFVFGEAQVGQRCAVVSSHRLRQEFYGLPPDEDLLGERLLKEAVHELGHTLQLPHCGDYRCAMAPSHAVEWIDVKGSGFCRDCRTRVLAGTAARPSAGEVR